MKYLLNQDGRRALDAFCMSDVLFAFDYDGTLAPIVDDPSDAKMRTRTTARLRELATLTPVAIISGRSRSNVLGLSDCVVDYVIGNHGLEGLPSGSSTLEHAEDSCKKWSRILDTSLKEQGVTVEDKAYSLAIHYRLAQDKKLAKARILEVAGSLEPSPRIVMGKCVVNLVSPGAPHKGVALLELMLRSGCRSAVYFGDDDNDEDVFALGEESILTVRIGKDGNSAALFFLHTQGEVDSVIEICVDSLRRSGKVNRSATGNALGGSLGKQPNN